MSRSARTRLTASGRAVAVGSACFAVLGTVSGYREYVVIAAVGAVVVLVALAVPRAGSPLVLRRRDLPRLIQRGETVRITLVAEAEHSTLPSRIHDQLGSTTVVVDLPAVTAGEPTVVGYRIRAATRGPHQLGPVLEERGDPFGLATRTIRHDVIDEILIHPVIHRLALPDNASRAREALEARARLSDDPTADFRSLREYVPGDDQRRIHWLSSARTGTVLVRDTFELRRATKTVVLETLDRTIEPALFEDAVEIAASLVLEAMRRQISVVARTRDRACPGRPTALTHREEALELFTRVRRTTEPATVRTASVLGSREPSDQIIVIAGASSPLVAQLGAAPALAGRVLVIRLAPDGAALARLPIRSVDVSSVDHFLHRWRRGEVAA